MSGFSGSPKLTKGGLVVLAPGGGVVRRTIALQYNPESLTRSYKVQGAGGDGGSERAQPFRLKGPAVETIKLEAQIDATDRLEFPHEKANESTVEFGIAPQLAALEALINPSVDELMALDEANSAGTLEIIPPEAPLVLFVWGKNRVQAVKVVSLSITEEAFDPTLNPTQAKVSLDLQVMSTDDLGFAHRGGGIFMSHLKKRELMARAAGPATLSSIGLTRLP